MAERDLGLGLPVLLIYSFIDSLIHLTGIYY